MQTIYSSKEIDYYTDTAQPRNRFRKNKKISLPLSLPQANNSVRLHYLFDQHCVNSSGSGGYQFDQFLEHYFIWLHCHHQPDYYVEAQV